MDDDTREVLSHRDETEEVVKEADQRRGSKGGKAATELEDANDDL